MRLYAPEDWKCYALYRHYYEEFYKLHPEPDFSDMDDDTADAICLSLRQRRKQYIDQHMPPIWLEYCDYLKHWGDEGELNDKDGSHLLDSEGNYIQDWHIDAKLHVVRDKANEQLFYSDGAPIIATPVSAELECLMRQWWGEWLDCDQVLW